MIAAVADTHAALWLLYGDPRLSTSAKNYFDHAAAQGHKIALSPISLAEVVYLIDKKRLPREAFENLVQAIKDPDHILEEGPFTREVAAAMQKIPRDLVPDMPDRIVAATAVYLGVPVISRDGRIRASNVDTIR
jgi:PIN domain nuclease of toxin-antitoxin system